MQGFLFLKYPDPWGGGILVFGVTFLLVLMYAMILEIDDPCVGLWFIKSIRRSGLKSMLRITAISAAEKARTDFLNRNNGHHHEHSTEKVALTDCLIKVIKDWFIYKITQFSKGGFLFFPYLINSSPNIASLGEQIRQKYWADRCVLHFFDIISYSSIAFAIWRMYFYSGIV